MEIGRSIESKKFVYTVLAVLLPSPFCSDHGWQELDEAFSRKTQVMGKLRLTSPSSLGRSRGAEALFIIEITGRNEQDRLLSPL